MFDMLPSFVVRPLVWLIQQSPWLSRKANEIAINTTVNVCRHRPHPWSTVHDYVSWTSLTDQRWSARHLPAGDSVEIPSAQALTALFRREGTPQEMCNKSTCLFPAFAQYLTDGFIRTRMNDESKGEPETVRLQNTSNHQIDLCPLYGRTRCQTAALRLMSEARGHRGRLKSQTNGGEEFAPFLFDDTGGTLSEFKELDPPLGVDSETPAELKGTIFAFGGDRANAVPQVAMLNTLFLREHNRLAGELEQAHPSWDDERVFQTARNAVIVIFIKIVVEEYINHISPSPIGFLADPAVAWDAPWNKPNWITTEFSLLYRWHSLVPDTIEWNGKRVPVHLTFRNNTPLLEGGLARAFIGMSAQRAGRLGAFNTTEALVPVEVRAVEQGRLCRLQPYAKYREYVSLPAPNSFEDISADKRVTDLLKKLYQSPKDVDFYIGLFAEDPTKNSPLPPLILRMVAVDAFSQALTNPLLAKSVFNKSTFSKVGWEAIHSTSCLKDVLMRNCSQDISGATIGMTRAGWQFQW